MVLWQKSRLGQGALSTAAVLGRARPKVWPDEDRPFRAGPPGLAEGVSSIYRYYSAWAATPPLGTTGRQNKLDIMMTLILRQQIEKETEKFAAVLTGFPQAGAFAWFHRTVRTTTLEVAESEKNSPGKATTTAPGPDDGLPSLPKPPAGFLQGNSRRSVPMPPATPAGWGTGVLGCLDDTGFTTAAFPRLLCESAP